MLDDIVQLQDTEIADPSQVSNPTRRKIAEAIGSMAEQEIYAASVGKKVTYINYMSQMIWDLVTSGTMLFSDGTPMQITTSDEWLRVVKFLSNHLDGPTGVNQEMALNLFKVYVGVDADKV